MHIAERGKDLRHLLSLLREGDDGLYLSISSDGQRVFSEATLQREPMKWLKYLLMDRAGIESIRKIESQIRRFPSAEYREAAKYLRESLRGEPYLLRSRMIVAKVVPWDRAAQLKNYRLFSIGDLDRALREIQDDLLTEAYQEIWCCESSVSTSGFNLGGRVTWPGIERESIIELVWYRSPRYVEMVSLPEFETPYLRATRLLGKPLYSIETLHVPAVYGNRRQGVWRDEFHVVLRELNRRASAMRTLVRVLRLLGAGEICFCFKVSDGEMTVIDWDTEIESTSSVKI